MPAPLSSIISSLKQRFTQQPVWLALVFVVLLAVWLMSGADSQQLTSQDASNTLQQASPLAKVQVDRMQAQPVNREVTLYGRTEPDRIATLRAEVQGQVTEVLVAEGVKVKQGQALIRIDDNDLKQRLASANALLKQREIELQGAQKLGRQGLQSEANLAAALANLEQAQAQVESLRLAIENTTIYAPFDGILNERFVEIGDLLRDGDRIASVVDLDPLVISADVTENYISQVKLKQPAIGRLVSGEMLSGEVRYISSVSNQGTNTFRIEVEIANNDYQYMAGMSTELSIPLEQTMAIKITPAVMSLDEEGNLGVKTVVSDFVRFVPIDIVKSDREGVWLAGLGDAADVIVLGHGYVRDGDKVEVFERTDSLNAGRQSETSQ